MSSHSMKQWLQHTASVPKGFLKYCVVKLLKEKPMSGSEIMETIKKTTEGRWKPSPGSVYPLLSWLQENGYTQEVPTEGSSIKRYKLTDKGEELFEEHARFKEKLQKKLKFLAPPIISAFWISTDPEKLRPIRDAERQFMRALMNLRETLKNNLTHDTIKMAGEFLEDTTEKIEKMIEKIEEEAK